MRVIFVIFAFGLSSCDTLQSHEKIKLEIIEVGKCPNTPNSIKLPLQPRTPKSIYEWARLTEIQRQKTAMALDECRKLYETLITKENKNVEPR